MENLLKSLSKALASFACIVLLAVMLITFVDVVGRYFFNSPITFAVEMIQLGMGLLVLFGLAITTLDRGHIAVDVLDTVAPKSVQRIFAMLAALSAVVFITLIAWRLWDRGIKFYEDGLATDVLFLPVWPVVILMAVAASVAAFIALVQFFIPSIQGDTHPLAPDLED